MNFILNLAGTSKKDEFSNSKKDVLKFLKIIGVDSRFVSITPGKIYINNLRFSKFSRKKEGIFHKHYGDIEVVRNSLFQKICSKSSRELSKIKPASTILIPHNYIIEIIMEPYTRKYGVKLVYQGKADLTVNPLILDDEIRNIFSSIFNGEVIKSFRSENEIYPLINVCRSWINSFLEMDGHETLKDDYGDDLAGDFMEFLEDVAPQYRENVLKASTYICSKLEVKQ